MGNTKVYSILVMIMLAWGLNVTALKTLVDHLNPITMSAVRIFIAGTTVLIILALLKKTLFQRDFPWKYIVIISLLGVVCHHLFLAVGIQRTSAVKTSIILGFGPLLTALLSMAFKLSQLTYQKFSGFVLGTVGVILTVLNGAEKVGELQLGDFYIFLSILLQAFSFIFISKASKLINPMILTGYILIIGSIILFAISLIIEPGGFTDFQTINSNVILVLFASAIFATAIGHMLYNTSIKLIGPAEAAIFVNFSTIFALIGAYYLLNEPITLLQMVGCLLIMIGVVVGTSGLKFRYILQSVFSRMKSWVGTNTIK
ncbi:DMT family transporter [Viridibacillus arvi]|uniref:DMT family transporter n=1 Tax=Viridibacillus arvi TaxID=263475 RepID=UPI00367EACC8